MAPQSSTQFPTDDDVPYLRLAVDLARAALDAGDEPFGSVLVDANGTVRLEERNHARSVDPTRHPEFEIARWAATHLSATERRDSTVYTSGEHCPMCSAAHARVGLGRIVYAASSAQLTAWHQDWGVAPGPVPPLPISAIAPHVEAHGPVPEFEHEIRTLHARLHGIALPE